MADRRLTPARPDLAAAHLKGTVAAARFVEGEAASVTAPRAPLRAAPSDDAPQDSELLHGERVTVYDRKDGWAWVQAASDGYVGYVRDGALGAPFAPGARVILLATPLLAAPDVKAPLRALLPLNARIAAGRAAGDFVETAGGFVHRRALAPLAQYADDFVAVAERFLGAPYVWGGKSAAGLDCSGLVQTALEAAGIAAPRDTDMMEKALGAPVAPGDLRRGDLVFWKGHMGVMQDASRLLHANAFHMQVASEPLAEAIARIAKAGGAVTAIRRLR